MRKQSRRRDKWELKKSKRWEAKFGGKWEGKNESKTKNMKIYTREEMEGLKY